MVEWFKAQHWKCCLEVTLTRVRIPLSPKNFILASLVQLVERRSPKPGVEGSSPSGRVFLFLLEILFGIKLSNLKRVLGKNNDSRKIIQ